MRLDPITLQDQGTLAQALTNPILLPLWRSRSQKQLRNPLQSDDHSVLEPPLPFPNRTVKQDRADDSGASPVKVGHRQTHPTPRNARSLKQGAGVRLSAAGSLTTRQAKTRG